MYKVGVLPLNGFALMSYASLVEPFRAANFLSEKKYYKVINFSESKEGTVSSSGLKISGDYYIGDIPKLDIFFVIAGGDPFKYNNKKLYHWINKIAQKGDDITIVSYSYMMVEALRCASILEKCGINAEVIDLRSIRPLDESTILKSVSKTGRLLTIDNGWSKYGIGSEIVSLVAEKRLKFLKSPPIRLGPNDVPIPSTRALANLVYPSTYEILKSVEKSLGKELLGMNWDNLPKVEDTPDKTFQGPF